MPARYTSVAPSKIQCYGSPVDGQDLKQENAGISRKTRRTRTEPSGRTENTFIHLSAEVENHGYVLLFVPTVVQIFLFFRDFQTVYRRQTQLY